jgi:AraC-like DNA-binding protein
MRRISGKYAIKETAKRRAYNGKQHFYKQFKEVCGIPPPEWIPKNPVLGRRNRRRVLKTAVQYEYRERRPAEQ